MFRHDMIPMFLMDEGDAQGGDQTNPPAGDQDGSGDPNAAGDKKAAGDGDGQKPGTVSMTQDELDKLIGREKAKAKSAALKEAEDARKQADMTEAEKLKAEKDAAEKGLTEAQARANARVVKAEAKIALTAKGVTAERLDRAIRLVNLDGVDVGDDGEPDGKQIAAAVDALLKDIPELVSGASGGKGGADISGGGGGEPLTDEAIAKMTPAEYAKNIDRITAYYKNKRGTT